MIKNLNTSRTELESLINEYVIGNNALRDRDILKDRLIDGLTYYQLSDQYNLSLATIKKIINKREKHIFQKIG